MKLQSFFKIGFWVLIASGIAFVGIQERHIQSALERYARPAQLFSPKILENPLLPRREWDVRQSKNMHRFFYIASQSTCTWIGKGETCCIFNFGHDRYVLKLVRFDTNKKTHGLLKRCMLYRAKCKPSFRLKQALYSAKIAMEDLAEQTGLQYVHLNQTMSLIANIKIRDFYGQEFRLYGDGLCFVVQDKAVPFIEKICALMKDHDVEEAQKHIDRVLDLYIDLSRKGYRQKDVFSVGFVAERAIFMDPWHFEKVPKCRLHERVAYAARQTLRPVEMWLCRTYPILGEHYQNSLKRRLSEIQS